MPRSSMATCLPAAAFLGLVLSACGALVTPTATPATPPSGVGILHLTAEPGYDTHDPLRLRYVLADGFFVTEVDEFPADTAIFLDRSLPAGPVRVFRNDTACDGTVVIEANVVVDVLLSAEDDACTVSTSGSHAPGAIEHPEPRTALAAFVVVDSILVVTPLDPGNAIQPIRVPANNRAEVQDFEVPPGRYELALLVDDVVLSRQEIDLMRGQEFWFNLRALPRDFTFDCGSIPAEECNAAVEAAYTKDYSGYAASTRVTSAQVIPSGAGGCMPPLVGVPVLDVLFDGPDLPRTIEITVAPRPDGLFGVCTY